MRRACSLTGQPIREESTGEDVRAHARKARARARQPPLAKARRLPQVRGRIVSKRQRRVGARISKAARRAEDEKALLLDGVLGAQEAPHDAGVRGRRRGASAGGVAARAVEHTAQELVRRRAAAVLAAVLVKVPVLRREREGRWGGSKRGGAGKGVSERSSNQIGSVTARECRRFSARSSARACARARARTALPRETQVSSADGISAPAARCASRSCSCAVVERNRTCSSLGEPSTTKSISAEIVLAIVQSTGSLASASRASPSEKPSTSSSSCSGAASAAGGAEAADGTAASPAASAAASAAATPTLALPLAPSDAGTGAGAGVGKGAGAGASQAPFVTLEAPWPTTKAPAPVCARPSRWFVRKLLPMRALPTTLAMATARSPTTSRRKATAAGHTNTSPRAPVASRRRGKPAPPAPPATAPHASSASLPVVDAEWDDAAPSARSSSGAARRMVEVEERPRVTPTVFATCRGRAHTSTTSLT
jgi:hypothetical protein